MIPRKSEVLSHISRSIRRRIEDAGYVSIEKFCNENALQKTTIYRAINGTVSPKLETLIDIADSLEITLQSLLDLDKINVSRAERGAIPVQPQKKKIQGSR